MTTRSHLAHSTRDPAEKDAAGALAAICRFQDGWFVVREHRYSATDQSTHPDPHLPARLDVDVVPSAPNQTGRYAPFHSPAIRNRVVSHPSDHAPRIRLALFGPKLQTQTSQPNVEVLSSIPSTRLLQAALPYPIALEMRPLQPTGPLLGIDSYRPLHCMQSQTDHSEKPLVDGHPLTDQ